MKDNPYWIAAKYAFVIAGGAGVALGGVKLASSLIKNGLSGLLLGFGGGSSDDDTSTETNTDPPAEV